MSEPAINLIRQALSHAGEDQLFINQLRRLENRRITPDKELPPMEFLFRLFDRPCFPRGELVGITGKPKSGKTFIVSILIALCQSLEILTIRRESSEPLHVLWYDTEQSDESTQDILKNRIIPMVGPHETIETMKLFETTSEGGLQVFNVRQEPWNERLPLLETAIKYYKPDLVVLDGIRDLINDINDGVLAQDTVERLMHLATDQHCCIACILHQNKSAEDKNLRGWIGTELTHKAFEVYECEKGENRVFTFSQALTRKYDILDKLKYIVNENGIPELATDESIAENSQGKYPYNNSRPTINKAYLRGWDEGNKPIMNLPLLFSEAMPKEDTMYTPGVVMENVMKLSNITSSNFYSKCRDQALSEGIIHKTSDEFRHIVYYRKGPDLFSRSPGDLPF